MINQQNDVTGNVQLAERFAMKAHGDQKYGDEFPYVLHLRAVLAVAVRYGITDWRVLVLCLIHDTGEDTPVTYEDVEMYFGTEVADAWTALSEPQEINGVKATRKQKHAYAYPRIRGNWLAVTVKLCDRLANTEAGAGKVAMYRKEHPEFKRYFRDVEIPDEFKSAINQLWVRLDAVLMNASAPEPA